MIFFKNNIISITIIVVAIWVMPATSNIQTIRGMV